jgi:hypothetical protein
MRIDRDFDPEAVRRIKAAADRDLSVGGPELAGHAIRAGLVDECHEQSLESAGIESSGLLRELGDFETRRIETDALGRPPRWTDMADVTWDDGNPCVPPWANAPRRA